MKIDWKARYEAEVKATKRLKKELAQEFGFISFIPYDISRMDFGTAKYRCKQHLPRVAKLLGAEYIDYFNHGGEM